MDDELKHGEKFQQFEKWYQENQELVANLQDWLFYLYATPSLDGTPQEVMVEVADVTVYLELFYLSSKQGNKYEITSTVKEMAEILETDDQVVLNALNSLQEHNAIEYQDNDGELKISIKPIIAVSSHMHHHDHTYDHNHDHNHGHND